MKKHLQKYLSIALSFLVLLSTFSFTVEKHFCGDILVDQALFSKAKTCGMMMGESLENTVYADNGMCCTDEHIAVEGQDELKISFNSLDIDQQVFIMAATISYLNLFEVLSSENTDYTNYIPPLLVNDIQILDQVFLI